MEEEFEYSYLRSTEVLDVPYSTIPEIIRQHSQKAPESIVHEYINWETFEKENLTFSELYNSATDFARGLMKIGIGKGDVVALGTDNTPEWMTAMFGIQMSGATPMMFAFNLKDGSDIESLLGNVKDKCKAVAFTPGENDKHISIISNVFTKGKDKGSFLSSRLPRLQFSILLTAEMYNDFLTTSELCNLDQSELQPLPFIDPEDVAAIFMTSGSTGDRKLIPHSHFTLLSAGANAKHVFFKSGSTYFNDRPFSWIGGLVNHNQ